MTFSHPILSGLPWYTYATTLSAPALKLWLKRRQKEGKEDPQRINERYGIASQPRPNGHVMWCHGASVGESLCVQPLLKRIRTLYPEWTILMTTGTITSAQLMQERLPDQAIHQYIPLDHPCWIKRFLDHWNPDVVVWLESDLWPNTLRMLQKRRIPSVLANARLSDKSYAFWEKHPETAQQLLKCFTHILTQGTVQQQRFSHLVGAGVPHVGNLKYDVPPLPYDETVLADLRQAIGQRPVWVASSTHHPEEESMIKTHALLKEHYPTLLTIIAPRHPKRGHDIATYANNQGYRATQRSLTPTIAPETEIYIADTMGELGLWYRLANLVFVGGSLIPHGGQNVIEPALLDTVILHGEHMFNFTEVITTMQDADATLYVKTPEDIAHYLRTFLDNPQQQVSYTQQAKAVAQSHQGATERTLDYLRDFMNAPHA